MKEKICIVNYADKEIYKKGQKRLGLSIRKYAPNIDYLTFDETHHLIPTHTQNPYAFKGYCIEKAIELGYTKIIWADSPIVLIKDISLLIEHLDKKGYFFFENIDYPLWKWISDKMLFDVANDFNLIETLTRKELREQNVKQIMGCFFGIDLKNIAAKHYIETFIAYCKRNRFFVESWNNNSNAVSGDVNVGGSRHDQSLTSLLLHIFEMDVLVGQYTFFAYSEHYKNFKIGANVCVNSIGII